MEHQSLYRRYRPSCFAELIGQRHVVAALRNSVRDNKVGHAYLFSGPRGTGKTSTARILAKAINCEKHYEGEPCGECESCLAFASGNSYDLHELDAASNNKVEDVRDLISKVSFGTPGRRKVYVLDEVHMLTTGAENALLKTLEEPPEHVCFVMCTTEPHKVAATVRSRAQHLLFELVTADKLAEHVHWIAEDADLSLSEADLNYAVRAGNGSVRDTLSALDQVVSAEGKPEDDDLIEEFVAALAARDTGKMLATTDTAIRSGKEPRVIAEEIVAALRAVFLCSVGADLSYLLPQEQKQAQERAADLPTAAITKTFEELGQALVSMRQSSDPRIDLELAFVRIGEEAREVYPSDKASDGVSGKAESKLQENENQGIPKNTGQNIDNREFAESPAPEHQPSSEHPPPPMPRDPSRVERARAEIREQLRSAAPKSRTNRGSSAKTAAVAKGDPDGAAYATSSPGTGTPTLGAVRRRRAAEQSESVPESMHQSGQPATQEEPEAHPEPPQTQTSTAYTYSNPQKSTAEAVGISEETMALVEEYFPDAKAVELPESLRQVAPRTEKQTSSQQPAAGPLPSRDEVTVAWGNEIFDALSPPLKRRFSATRFLESQDNAVRLAMPAAAVSTITAEQHQEVEAKLAEHFGYRVAVLLTEDDQSTPASPDPEILISKNAANASTGAASETNSAEDRLRKALSHDAAMTIEAEALETPQEVVPDIPQDSLFG